MEQYQQIRNEPMGDISVYVRRLSDNALINSQTNEEYLKWLAEGNTPLPPEEPTE
jgi:hypothetical protein